MSRFVPPDWARDPAAVAVVGTGAAGLACALALNDAGRRVALFTKTANATSGSTPLAQGGIAAALGDGDSPEDHAADTVAAGAGLVDPAVARRLTAAGAADMARRLQRGEMPADRAADGSLCYGREGAHGRARVLHAGGDASGRRLAGALRAAVAARPGIRLVTDALVRDLVRDGDGVHGLAVVRPGDGAWSVPVAGVVLATGGAGALWRATTNPPEATGDGIALAARAGATLADLEFMQFHPTALDAPGADGARLPLLTEALRGAGAVLLDGDGRPFMADEHEAGDLAPRDVVARAIARRRAEGGRPALDIRPVLATHGAHAFPQVMRLARDAGFDPEAEALPVTPAAHYHMGGIATDTAGRSSLPGLWACGETACTGFHGANRLASNSLLEALVVGRQAGETAAAEAPARTGATVVPAPAGDTADGTVFHAIRDIMQDRVGVARDGDGLRAARDTLTRMTVPAVPADATAAAARNARTVAGLVVAAALARRESRGAHHRRDFPAADPARAARRFITPAPVLPAARGRAA